MDYSKAIEITKNIYWVGIYVNDDVFQCHTYLIVDGDESIIVDSGSMLEFEEVKAKIESVTDLKNIKYIIAHHQDPDVCSNITAFEQAIQRDDLLIVTHPRNITLIKHYGIKSSYYDIEKYDYQLHTKNHSLEFLTTPYAHAPGAFTTYDKKSKILFSSDIFGGLEISWHFWANDDYFKEIKLFHEDYMPSQDILYYALEKFKKLDLEIIAPQHGSLIKKRCIAPLIEKLENLKCGLYIEGSYKDSIVYKNKLLEKSIEKEKKLLKELEQSKENLIKSEQRYKELATKDMLTGVLNRFAFEDELNRIISNSKRTGAKFALLFLDLDHFKEVNDTYGHDIGDKLLIEAAKRVVPNIRVEDVFARIGGDEFILIFTNLKTETLTILVDKAISLFRTPWIIDGIKLNVTTSMGVAIFPDDANNEIELMKKADAAMYKSKKLGRNQVVYFEK